MRKDNEGQSVIEVILAVAIFVIVISGVVVSILGVLGLNQGSGEEMVALEYAREGIDASRAIRNQGYSNLIDSSALGINNSSGTWSFGGSSNTFDKYTRVLKIEPVQRDASGNIVTSGGTVDSNTKKVTSTVTWQVSGLRNNSLALTSYLTNWQLALPSSSWSTPIQNGIFNAAGNGSGNKVAISGNYAYLTRSAGTPNFLVIDISNAASPTLVGSLTLGGSPQDISLLGNYIYVASDDNASELQVVNISNPSNPSLAGVLNLSGNTNSSSIYAIGTSVYLGRVSSSATDLYKISVTTPSSPTLVSSLELGATPKAIFATGNYAYLASSGNTEELQTINISLVTPTLMGSVNLAGNNDGLSITGNSANLFLGRAGGDLISYSISNPTSPVLLGTTSMGGDVNGLYLDGNNLLVASSNNAGEFRVLNVTTPAAPTLTGSLNTSGSLFGVYYSSLLDTAVAAQGSNAEELVVIKKQ